MNYRKLNQAMQKSTVNMCAASSWAIQRNDRFHCSSYNWSVLFSSAIKYLHIIRKCSERIKFQNRSRLVKGKFWLSSKSWTRQCGGISPLSEWENHKFWVFKVAIFKPYCRFFFLIFDSGTSSFHKAILVLTVTF